jgi:hypothetical protein
MVLDHQAGSAYQAVLVALLFSIAAVVVEQHQMLAHLPGAMAVAVRVLGHLEQPHLERLILVVVAAVLILARVVQVVQA